MRRSLLLVLVPALLLAGCKSRESQLIGTWTGGGFSYTLKEDKSFDATLTGVNLKGTWTFEDPNVKATIKTANGSPVEEVVKQVEELSKTNPMVAQLAGQIGDLNAAMKKPTEMVLSEDAKTLQLKNPLNGQTLDLKKSE